MDANVITVRYKQAGYDAVFEEDRSYSDVERLKANPDIKLFNAFVTPKNMNRIGEWKKSQG